MASSQMKLSSNIAREVPSVHHIGKALTGKSDPKTVKDMLAP